MATILNHWPERIHLPFALLMILSILLGPEKGKIARAEVSASTDPGAVLEQDTPFYIQQKRTEQLFMSALEHLAAFVDATCVAGPSKDRFRAHMKSTVDTLLAQQKDGLELLNDLSRPMQGDGTCDGGFNAVAKESKNRVRRTERSIETNEKLAKTFATSYQQVLVNGTVQIDGAQDTNCAMNNIGMVGTMNTDGAAIGQQFEEIRKSLEFEKRRLEDFERQNLELAARCARHDLANAQARFEEMKQRYAKLQSVHKHPELYTGDITGVKVAMEKSAEGRKLLEDPTLSKLFQAGKQNGMRSSDITSRSPDLLGHESRPKSAEEEILGASGARDHLANPGNGLTAESSGLGNADAARAELRAMMEGDSAAVAAAENTATPLVGTRPLPPERAFQDNNGVRALASQNQFPTFPGHQTDEQESLFERVHRCYQRSGLP